jgi:hypothetical protein
MLPKSAELCRILGNIAEKLPKYVGTFGHIWAHLGTIRHNSAQFGTIMISAQSGTSGHNSAHLGTFGHNSAQFGASKTGRENLWLWHEYKAVAGGRKRGQLVSSTGTSGGVKTQTRQHEPRLGLYSIAWMD